MTRSSPRFRAPALEQFLRQCRIDGIQAGDYLQRQINRFAATLEWLPPLRAGARVLEIGAAPYWLSIILLEHFPIDLVTTSFPYDYGERPAQVQGAVRVTLPDGRVRHIPYFHVNMERESFPGKGGQFDLILCCEVLEHLARDPMALWSEMNRLLVDGGQILLTTPNTARAGGIRLARRGLSPHVWAQYSQYGVYGRHNREYTALELRDLAQAAGFQVQRLETLRFFEPRSWEPARFSGDTSFVLAKKVGPVRDRLPAQFYDFSGWYEHHIELLEQHSNGTEWTLRVAVENRGGEAWQPGQVQLGLQMWKPHNILIERDCKRFDLPRALQPGERLEMTLGVPPLSERNTYYRLDLVKVGEFWFEWRGSRPLDVLP